MRGNRVIGYIGYIGVYRGIGEYLILSIINNIVGKDNLKFRNNESELIVYCANSITSLFRGQLYEIYEQKRVVLRTVQSTIY